MTADSKSKKLILVNPRGFCAGVDRAIEIVEKALVKFGSPIYVRHEIVHNKFVVNDLKSKGAIFVEELSEVPDDAIVIFSAHGVSKAVQDEAADRGLKVFDATCPLVRKVHNEVRRCAENGQDVILIGHNGHPEVEGTKGQFNGYVINKNDITKPLIHVVETVDDIDFISVSESSALSYVTQTTISADDSISIVEALEKRFPNISGPRKADVCYATQNRQDAVKKVSKFTDVLFVVGSTNSSNSNRLREIGETYGMPSFLIEDALALSKAEIADYKTVAVTAGASAPEILVKQVVDRFKGWGFAVEELEAKKEDVEFSLPQELLNIN